MESIKKTGLSIRKQAFLFLSVLFSGICWYLANGLSGNYWFLIWIAPVPVLWFSLKESASKTFWIAFIAYLIGRLSWFGYLVSVATMVPAIILTMLLPLIFSLIILLSRWVIHKKGAAWGVFAFPVFFTVYEWLLITFSPDGSAASIAYSQANVLPLIQMVSLTGLLGITFMITFIPSAIALGWHYRKELFEKRFISGVGILLIASVFMFGFIRLWDPVKKVQIQKIGMVVLEEKSHKMKVDDFNEEVQHTKNYITEIEKLADQGISFVLLPERALNINAETDTLITGMLRRCAIHHHLYLIAGYTNYKSTEKRNSVLVVDDRGNVIMDYDKRHMVKGFEDMFVKGTKLGTFNAGKLMGATVICKDMDFPGYISEYGKLGVSMLFIPAWDFVVDDWLHSRMAVLRGVENGFPEARAARLGRLTISDEKGRIISETNTTQGNKAIMIGKFSFAHNPTFYAKHGDWFGILVLLSSVMMLVLTIFKKSV